MRKRIATTLKNIKVKNLTKSDLKEMISGDLAAVRVRVDPKKHHHVLYNRVIPTYSGSVSYFRANKNGGK